MLLGILSVLPRLWGVSLSLRAIGSEEVLVLRLDD